jgi:hypothetical protein
MDYQDEFDRLGGIRPLFADNIGRLSDEEISQIEGDMNAVLPDDYRDFLKNYGVYTFNNELVCFKPFKNQAEYVHPEADGIPNFTFSSSSISVFFGKHKGSYDLFRNLSIYEDRKPDSLLPILTDGMGNFVGIYLGKEKYGNVFFWDHECEWDAEDYLEETGREMKEEVKYQNLWLVGNDFTDFCKRLYIMELKG